MAYEPPSKANWVMAWPYDPLFAEVYTRGYHAAHNGVSAENNPYTLSGHERDTTYKDELHEWWWHGWNDRDEERICQSEQEAS